MTRDKQSSVKFVSHLLTKIYFVKFDDMNNFEIWRCEVMDALTVSNPDESLRFEEKPEETSEKDWDIMNRMV